MEPRFRNQDKLVRMLDILFPKSIIYLFGSYARGTQKQSSDIDLAIDAGRMLTSAELGQALNVIEALNVLARVDLVDLHGGIPERLKEVILKEGIVLWKG